MRDSRIWITVAFVGVLLLPFLFRQEKTVELSGEDTLIVITPHNESIRSEFARGFAEQYEEQTGRTVAIDWRVIGGTSEIARYLGSEYLNAFRNHWTGELGRSWSLAVQSAFNNRRITPDDTPEDDTPEESARRAFLNSDVGCGIDIFFGGGVYDFDRQARMGQLVDSGILERHPEWFGEEAIPQNLQGERFWDPDGRWIGTVLSSFGIIYNRDVLDDIGITRDLEQWTDLTDPRLRGQIAVCDPTKSGSITQAFEMIIQQQMQQAVAAEAEAGGADPQPAITRGWLEGMRLIQRICANARYFTDRSTKPSIDVSTGDCAAGMTIDFYGRFQEETVRRRGSNRLGYVTPIGGSTVSVDPIGILRGAPHPDLARAFVDYVLSLEGQKLWNFRVGTPGGPETYALRRPPIRPELYEPPFNELRSDEEVFPYDDSASFRYESEWTGSLFSPIRFIIRVAFMDLHPELTEAWEALVEAGFPEGAMAHFGDLSSIDYGSAQGHISEVLSARDPIEEVRFAQKLAAEFRARYRNTVRLAKSGQ